MGIGRTHTISSIAQGEKEQHKIASPSQRRSGIMRRGIKISQKTLKIAVAKNGRVSGVKLPNGEGLIQGGQNWWVGRSIWEF